MHKKCLRYDQLKSLKVDDKCAFKDKKEKQIFK